MFVSQLETPALIVDLDVLERNQTRAMDLLRPLGVALRPHYKSHKCTAIAHMQLAGGAKGITCAKLSEAEDLIQSGVEDVLIENQVVEPAKLMRLGYLAGCCRLSVCVDTLENIRALESAAAAFGTTIHCLVEYEVGMRRCGVATPQEALARAEAVRSAPHLPFLGIQAYAGQLSHAEDFARRSREAARIEGRLRELLAFLHENGVDVPEVSGASTGTVELRGADTAYTEVQAGTYLFMDAAYDRVGVGFEHSLFLLSTVVSADAEHVVCDAGLKTIGVDQGNPVFADFPAASVNMSEEHCVAHCANRCAAGDKLRLIPGHCCTTVNLFDAIYFVRDGRVVDRVPVTSRGKSR